MSGLGSYTSLLPGQCTPVVLFVFVDDFSEIYHSGNMEQPSETSLNVSSSSNSSARPGMPTKGSSSVVVLARPVNKSEGGLRKKIQSSLEAQIRFSIKKCRTLSVFESNHAGSRTGTVASSAPLFSLDASKAVSLVDACSSQSGESLEFAIGLVEQNAVIPPGETVAASSDPYESALSHLENGIGMNTRFSTSWCEKAFPVAKEVYLEDLPPCYPSFQHEDHLKKALHVLTSMVKGPAVQLYVKKLKDECLSIWSSGRQLCDAVSLTGNPCIHQKHDIDTLSTEEIKHHSSGFAYLHACACGRSRRLRPDPFDFEAANVAGNTFIDCDKLVPSVKLPEGIIKGAIRSSSWNLIRVGGARYYDPSKGLIQSGFRATQKFLPRWTIFLEKLKETSHSLLNDFQQGSLDRDPKFETAVDANSEASDSARLGAGITQNGVGTPKKPSSDIIGNDSKNISTGRGLSNFTMRKPFSEVVAGSAANSGFPPLFSRKQPIQDAEKGVKLHNGRHGGLDKLGDIVYSQESQNVKTTASVDNSLHNGTAGNASNYGDSFPHIGNNIASLNRNGVEQIKAINSKKAATIYVGFEHECPCGHRFILTQEHLSDLGSSYSAPEANVLPLSVENLDKKQDHAKLGRTRRLSHGIVMGGGIGKAKNLEKSKEKVANGNMPSNKSMPSTRHGKSQNERTEVVNLVEDLDSDRKPTSIDDHDGAFSLLNRNLPIYMNCPHCGESRTKNNTSNVKYASTISQLQRIFVVTPSLPIVLAVNPIIQFELSCLPPSIPDRELKLQFSLGCPVILPPDSFLSLRLPFVYGVELDDGSLNSLKPFENQPHLTAYIMRGTSLQIIGPWVAGHALCLSLKYQWNRYQLWSSMSDAVSWMGRAESFWSDDTSSSLRHWCWRMPKYRTLQLRQISLKRKLVLSDWALPKTSVVSTIKLELECELYVKAVEL
ncbi:hypothetical protein C2S51_002484 [Perilla frutescens var. frutescens]|nr:hypothetical protein C2S51_002484 [Perilla frutescens var. frutescens]